MNITIKDIQELMDDKEINMVIDNINQIEKMQMALAEKNDACIKHYNKSISYLIKAPVSIPYKTDTILDENNKQVPEIYTIHLANNGITQSSSVNTWMRNVTFNQFAQLIDYNYSNRSTMNKYSLMTAMLSEQIYEPLLQVLTDEGINIFNKLAIKYNELKPIPITNIKGFYPVSNITDDERTYFGIKTPNAAIYMKNHINHIFLFLSNGKFMGEKEHPTFKYRVFSKEKDDRVDYIPERVFVHNHLDDIIKGVQSYSSLIIPKLNVHSEFLDYANSLVQRYAVLSQI